jgi:uncharacterized protein (UPF0332 family)
VTSADIIAAILRKAEKKLETGRKALADGDYDSTATAAYYAAFHAITAVLKSRDLAFSSHAQVLGAFNKQFVATGMFPRGTARVLERLFSDRQEADYGYDAALSEEAVRTDLADAEELVAGCRALLTPQASSGAGET